MSRKYKDERGRRTANHPQVSPGRTLYVGADLDPTSDNNRFTTVKEACDSIAATATPTVDEPWIILVAPGVYDEEAFTIPEFTTLQGAFGAKQDTWHPVRLTFSDIGSGTCITLSSGCNVKDLAVSIPQTDVHTGDVIIFERDDTGTSACGLQGITVECLRNDANDTTILRVDDGNVVCHECTFTGMQFGAGEGWVARMGGSAIGTAISLRNCFISYIKHVPALMSGAGAGSRFSLTNVALHNLGSGNDLEQTAGQLLVINCPYTDSSGTITAGHTTIV